MAERSVRSLEELAAIEMATYIGHSSIAVVECPQDYEPNAIYERFKSLVTCKIPPLLANKLTNMWLCYIDWALAIFKLTEESEMNLSHLIRAIIHPAVTNLDIPSTPNIHAIILRILAGMKKLETLKHLDISWNETTNECLLDNFSCLTNLVSLHVHYCCTNEILDLVGDSCPNVMDIDIYSSQSVGDESMPAILKLTKLTALDIFDTNISADCCNALIQALRDRGNRLTKFGCSGFAPSLMLTFSEHTIVTLRTPGRFLPLMNWLDGFSSLKSLFIHTIHPSIYIHDFFAHVKNLVHLELHDVPHLEVYLIGRYCQHLVRYEMHNCNHSTWGTTEFPLEEPVFKNLEVLRLHNVTESRAESYANVYTLQMIIFNALNLKCLSFVTYRCKEFSLSFPFYFDRLNKLEEFHLRFKIYKHAKLKLPKTLRHCKNMCHATINDEVISYNPRLKHFQY